MQPNEIVEVKPFFAVRVWKNITGGLLKSLGQLATKNFWVRLVKAITDEMISAFIKTIGLGFLGYVKNRGSSTIIEEGTQAATGSNAFSGPYTRPDVQQTSSYSNHNYSRPPQDLRNYPVNPPAPSSGRFQGF